MPGAKRPRESDDVDYVHPSRKRRAEDGASQTKLAVVYNALADESEPVRRKAAGDLILLLFAADSADRAHLVNGATTRLLKGLCSGRKAARLGFSVALSGVLELAFGKWANTACADWSLYELTERISHITEPGANASGQEQREHFLGRRFAFQSVLNCGVAASGSIPDAHWRHFLSKVVALAVTKAWLRTECGAMLNYFLISGQGGLLSDDRIQVLLDVLRDGKLLESAEGVALWLAIADRWPKLLPKGIWRRNDPFSAEEQPRLRKVLIGGPAASHDGAANARPSDTGARQSRPSFAWEEILLHAYDRKPQTVFKHFWDGVVLQGFFTANASTERKAVGLQIIAMAVEGAPLEHLYHILHVQTLRNVVMPRLETARLLFEAAELPLKAITSRARKNPELSHVLLSSLLSARGLDQRTKSKTIESLFQLSDPATIKLMVQVLITHLLRPLDGNSDDQQATNVRRSYADLALLLVRSQHKSGASFSMDDAQSSAKFSDLQHWLKYLVTEMVQYGYLRTGLQAAPQLTDSEREVLRSRLNSCISVIMDHSSVDGSRAMNGVAALLYKHKKELCKPLSEEAEKTIETARETVKSITEPLKHSKGTAAAYALLFNSLSVQLFGGEEDALEALQDLQVSYKAQRQGGDSFVMLTELVLSLLSKQTALLRNVAEQVFGSIANETTAEGLQSLTMVLAQKESLAGQQELFDERDEDDVEDGTDYADEGDSDGIVDVEDASDVEMVNGEASANMDDEEPSDGDDVNDDSSDVVSGASGELDEEAAFDRKLAAVLETAGEDGADSGDDDSDMDDEQMMALEPHLTKIFQERQKAGGKKQEKKDAKENIVSFKSRVLDLLAIYVKSQYANVLSMDLILPLASLVRTTSSKAVAEKAFGVLRQYFEACTKHKSLPQPDDQEACFGVLQEVHDEIKLGGSKLHAHACSRSSLFLSKVLVAINPQYYNRVADMYCELQKGWYVDGKSKVQGSIFTEWMSWSISTRSQGRE
ncbi:hypothetical protein BAUCODRAFT_34410 [Baudoinia panamericana UAMH 10762]|uniref:DNA polymerase V n=1 Tax=Baudoinia panamericana (strain UAMH 10762) TaxID=717646 RepID=M2N9X7_BAUPA|nr:uncharacterized protein BAUCODRAFT_34410 [Baudoinia panamericana UAMH 10762]EMC95650.1 hypothetical protein BAUCODRAFT_34410 [Baudoinia panamericana UAMH 10762]